MGLSDLRESPGRRRRKPPGAPGELFLGILSTAALLWMAVGGPWSPRRRRRRARPEPRLRRAAPRPSPSGGDGRAKSLANDLANNLAAIQGYCEFSKLKRPRDTDLAQRMDASMDSCDEAAVLVDQLLACAREPSP